MTSEITALQRDLNQLANVVRDLRTFERELRRCTGNRRFHPGNGIAWSALHSHYRMLLVDLAAWLERLDLWIGQYVQGAVLARLRNSKSLAAKVASTNGRHPERWIQKHHEAQVLKSRGDALRSLFGKHAVAQATARDVAKLRQKVRNRRLLNLKASRDEIAHRFGRTKGTAAIGLGHLAARIRNCGTLMNNLRLLVDSSTYVLPSVEPSKNDERCNDLVDLVLLGTIRHAVDRWSEFPDAHLWQKRERHYRALRANHRKDPTKLFGRH